MKLRAPLPLLLISPLLHTPSADAEDFSIEFDWNPEMKECFSKESPEIRLHNVPEGTTELRVSMKDRDAPTFRHGGGRLEYSGQPTIPEGALKSWKGPCPPYGSHTYEFRVEARAQKNKLGTARHSRKYP